MKFLVDATVLSEPTKPAPNRAVLRWLESHAHEFAVDPVILGELHFGILLLPKGRKRAALERWFDTGVRLLHCVAWDAETGLRWASVLADLRRKGQAMPVKDSLIAATALVHDLTVVTRNRVDFSKAGVKIVDPFQPA